ncbi:hypothetical protein Esti_000013 [Eimeria stiedai]
MEEQRWLGLTLAFLAAFFTGSYQVPRKLPALRKLMPPLEEQIYVSYVGVGFCLGCCCSSLLLPFNKVLMDSPLVGTDFIFTWWGALSGCLVLFALTMAFVGVSRLGIALNAACSMGSAALTSFCWGVFVNEDKVSLLWVDLLAVGLIVVGGAVVALFKEAGHPTATIKRLVSTRTDLLVQRRATFGTTSTTATEGALYDSGALEGGPPSEDSVGLGASPEHEGSSKASSVSAPLLRRSTTCPAGTSGAAGLLEDSSLPAAAAPAAPAAAADGGGVAAEGGGVGAEGGRAGQGIEGLTLRDRLIGTAASLASGFLGGASLGPMSFVSPNAKGLAFLPSFGIENPSSSSSISSRGDGVMDSDSLFATARVLYASLGVGAATLVTLLVLLLRKARLPSFHFRKAALPGLLSGLIYFCAALCVILAIPRISFSVAYPTKQSAVVFSGLWGVCFYSELRGRSVFVFVSGSLCILTGTALLANYTYPARLGIPDPHHITP